MMIQNLFAKPRRDALAPIRAPGHMASAGPALRALATLACLALLLAAGASISGGRTPAGAVVASR